MWRAGSELRNELQIMQKNRTIDLILGEGFIKQFHLKFESRSKRIGNEYHFELLINILKFYGNRYR